jgi:arylsulfatase A-like enzyme
VVDLAPTFLGAAGVPADKEMQGASLVPLFKGEVPKDWRKSFYYEYFEYPTPHHVVPHYGVVTDRYKLARFYVPTAEGMPKVDYWGLYDREKDPNETKDFYSDPAYAGTVKELKAELARLRKELKVPDRIPQEAYGRLFMPLKKK